MEPIEGVHLHPGRLPGCRRAGASWRPAAGRPVDVVVSDMAPNLSGIDSADAARIESPFRSNWRSTSRASTQTDGALVAKVFHGSGYSQLVELFKAHFVRSRPFKAKSLARPSRRNLFWSAWAEGRAALQPFPMAFAPKIPFHCGLETPQWVVGEPVLRLVSTLRLNSRSFG